MNIVKAKTANAGHTTHRDDFWCVAVVIALVSLSIPSSNLAQCGQIAVYAVTAAPQNGQGRLARRRDTRIRRSSEARSVSATPDRVVPSLRELDSSGGFEAHCPPCEECSATTVSAVC
jgi:hypothetical protein